MIHIWFVSGFRFSILLPCDIVSNQLIKICFAVPSIHSVLLSSHQLKFWNEFWNKNWLFMLCVGIWTPQLLNAYHVSLFSRLQQTPCLDTYFTKFERFLPSAKHAVVNHALWEMSMQNTPHTKSEYLWIVLKMLRFCKTFSLVCTSDCFLCIPRNVFVRFAYTQFCN